MAVSKNSHLNILVVVTLGGSTNAAPILNVCQVLAERGHTIEFATLEGREYLVESYPFVSKVHCICRTITKEEERTTYERLNLWNGNSIAGRKAIVATKKFNDSFWAQTYHGLRQLCQDRRPDLIFADYQITDAARDVSRAENIALSVMWCQMPWFIAPQPWIPGQPGMQYRCLTSEHASLSDRLYDETWILRGAPWFLGYLRWYSKERRRLKVPKLPQYAKPDHLLLVNSFWGLEPAKDLPPLVSAIGPILSDDYAPLTTELSSFLETYTKVCYVAFGTHVLLTGEIVHRLATSLNQALESNMIDAVVWSLKSKPKIEAACPVGEKDIKYENLFSNVHTQWFFNHHVPQRAVLASESVKLFLSHAGPSSVNEAIFHGVPIVAMPIYGDQIQMALRIKAAGIGLTVDKETSSATHIFEAIRHVCEDQRGTFNLNVLRMQHVARIASRRKYLGADLIEEFALDWRLRDSLLEVKEKRAMHLQTADARMSWLKRKNLDFLVLGLTRPRKS